MKMKCFHYPQSFNLIIYNKFHNILKLFDVHQIYFSPQVKRRGIVTYKHGIYELSHELPTQDLRKLGNIRKVSKSHRMLAQCPAPRQNKNSASTCNRPQRPARTVKSLLGPQKTQSPQLHWRLPCSPPSRSHPPPRSCPIPAYRGHPIQKNQQHLSIFLKNIPVLNVCKKKKKKKKCKQKHSNAN